MTLRDAYRSIGWRKSAYCENLVKGAIERRYPALRIETGKGAGSIEPITGAVELPPLVGSPDLYVYFQRTLICQIEVTGSDRIKGEMPRDAWIGHHKVNYAKTLEDPDSYGVFLFYGPNHQIRYFATASDIFKHTKGETIKTIRGFQERFHIIPVVYLKSERGFWEWLQCRIEKIL